jgi:putative ABC transport system ATP-binding protein
MSRQGPILQGRDLGRDFCSGGSKSTALAAASLRLDRGEFVLLMGPSGSGKSTLLAVLSGLLRPDRGQVLALDQDLWEMTDPEREEFRRRHFGFIFQGNNLLPALTARQQLEIILRWGEGVAAAEARGRADAMLARLGLAKKGHLLPGQLSGGEKQRVAIGRALVKEPAVCFADEPTSALDWTHGLEVVRMLQAAAERGTTILMVSHDARIVPYADRVLRLEDGLFVDPEAAVATTAPQPALGRTA